MSSHTGKGLWFSTVRVKVIFSSGKILVLSEIRRHTIFFPATFAHILRMIAMPRTRIHRIERSCWRLRRPIKRKMPTATIMIEVIKRLGTRRAKVVFISNDYFSETGTEILFKI